MEFSNKSETFDHYAENNIEFLWVLHMSVMWNCANISSVYDVSATSIHGDYFQLENVGGVGDRRRIPSRYQASLLRNWSGEAGESLYCFSHK